MSALKDAPRTKLAEVFALYRWASRKSMPQLSKEIGLDSTTLSRFERGVGTISSSGLVLILRWLLSDSTETLKEEESNGEDVVSGRSNDPGETGELLS